MLTAHYIRTVHKEHSVEFMNFNKQTYTCVGGFEQGKTRCRIVLNSTQVCLIKVHRKNCFQFLRIFKHLCFYIGHYYQDILADTTSPIFRKIQLPLQLIANWQSASEKLKQSNRIQTFHLPTVLNQNSLQQSLKRDKDERNPKNSNLSSSPNNLLGGWL